MRRFVVGDIHGSYSKLMKALELCKFSDSDILYCTGDISDRGKEVKECINFLMSLGNRFKPVLGNHDIWAYRELAGIMTREEYDTWWYNGSSPTIRFFNKADNLEEIKQWYASFPYIIEENDFRLVHSLTYKRKIDRSNIPLSQITMQNIYESGLTNDFFDYDEILFDKNILLNLNKFKEDCAFLDNKLTIIGHTALKNVFYDKEMNICDIDTGGFCLYKINGYEGKITVLDIDTKDFVDSSGFSSNLNRIN